MARLQEECWLRLLPPSIQTSISRAGCFTNEGGSFGPKGISRDKETGKILSRPQVHTPDELAADLADQILQCLENKSTRSKPYPPGTALIINCITNSLILPSEWDDAIERVRKAKTHLAFREVFLLEMTMSHLATLYGNRKRRHRRKAAAAKGGSS